MLPSGCFHIFENGGSGDRAETGHSNRFAKHFLFLVSKKPANGAQLIRPQETKTPGAAPIGGVVPVAERHASAVHKGAPATTTVHANGA